MPLRAPELESSPDAHRFLIQAQAEPSTLSRVMELFALRGLLPDEVSCERSRDNRGALDIRIVIPDLPPQKAAHLAARMRNIVTVSRVVLEPAPE